MLTTRRGYCPASSGTRTSTNEPAADPQTRVRKARLSGKWNDDDYDVLADGAVVGRIFKANAAPAASSDRERQGRLVVVRRFEMMDAAMTGRADRHEVGRKLVEYAHVSQVMDFRRAAKKAPRFDHLVGGGEYGAQTLCIVIPPPNSTPD